MDYLLGSTVTLFTIAAVLFVIRYLGRRSQVTYASFSQSQTHSLIYPLLMSEFEITLEKQSQSTKHYNAMYTKILFIKNRAYWITDNCFYVANLDEHGEVDVDSAEIVDTMVMNKVQLDEAMQIVEELTRGNGYDSRSTGKS